VPEHSTLIQPALNLDQSPSFSMRWIGTDVWMLRNKQNRCDDGFLVYPSIYHTQERLLPHHEYFKVRPDYYALIHGERSDDPACKLCYSNADTAREVAKNMAAMLDANPNIKLISLSPTDGQMWCECEGCRALDEREVPRDRSKSRRSLLFYNAVAAELHKAHPDARMLVGAYNVYNWPPKDTSIRADPMIDVVITHYEEYCMAHPVPDRTCPPNRRYVQLVKAWQSLGCGVYFYEYYHKTNWFDLPWPIVHSIRHDIPWFHQQGCQGVHTQYEPECIWSQFPVFYIAAKLMWNVKADVDALMEEMFTDLFGAAAPQMKAFWALMERQMATCGEHFPGQAMRYGRDVFTDSVRAQMRRHYEAAVRANEDETVAKRLAKIGTSMEYVDRLMRYDSLKRTAQAEPDAERSLVLARQALACGDRLFQEIRQDRNKWDGIVWEKVVRPDKYFGKDLRQWQKVVQWKELVASDAVTPLPRTWKFALDMNGVGQDEGWFEPTFDDRSWRPIRIGQTWQSQGHDYDGYAWYRLTLPAENDWLEREMSIYFTAVGREAWVYWNGRLLGHHAGRDEPFVFPIEPGSINTSKPNVIAVRVYDAASNSGIHRMVYLAKKP
jgi:hypothetical protein